jgi:hypothetical protein
MQTFNFLFIISDRDGYTWYETTSEEGEDSESTLKQLLSQKTVSALDRIKYIFTIVDGSFFENGDILFDIAKEKLLIQNEQEAKAHKNRALAAEKAEYERLKAKFKD